MINQTSRSVIALFIFVQIAALAIFLPERAHAQAPTVRLDRPDISVIDENRVSLSGGKPSFTVEGVRIGNADSELHFAITFTPEKIGHSIFHNFQGGIRPQKYPARLDVAS